MALSEDEDPLSGDHIPPHRCVRGAEMLDRLSVPFWFQAFGCTLGFDWHSSGVTTTVCGALKEGMKERENELGFYVAGGKGRTSRKTPQEIESICEKRSTDGTPLVYASRMAETGDVSVKNSICT